jgi:hypothetical protein
MAVPAPEDPREPPIPQVPGVVLRDAEVPAAQRLEAVPAPVLLIQGKRRHRPKAQAAAQAEPGRGRERPYPVRRCLMGT